MSERDGRAQRFHPPPGVGGVRPGRAPFGTPPAAQRGVPRRGGMAGTGVHPAIQRRLKSATRGAPLTQNITDRIREALQLAKEKLLHSQHKLEGSAAALRSQLDSRQ